MKKPSAFQTSLLSLLPIAILSLTSLHCTKSDSLGRAGIDDSGVDGSAGSGGSTATGGTTVPGSGGMPSTGGTAAASGGSTKAGGTTAPPLGGTPSTGGTTGSPWRWDMLPADNEVGTWVRASNPYLITDEAGLYGQIDGAAPKYIDRGWISSVYVNYSQGARTIQVAIHDMGSPAGAQAIYNFALPPARLAIPGLANAVVDMGLASSYAAYAYFDRFYVELNIDEKSATALASIESFMNDILDRISRGRSDAGTTGGSGGADGSQPVPGCRTDKIGFSQEAGCQNDGSVEFCLPTGDAAALAQVLAVDATVTCRLGSSGRAGCTEQLCMLPVPAEQCPIRLDPMPDPMWQTVCRLAALDVVAKIVPTLYE